MVKKILKYIAYTLFFILSLIYFAPKVAIYYLAENQLKLYDVVINNENLKDKGLSLDINNALVYFKGIQSADISEINIAILGIYNTLSLEKITLSSAAASFVPTKIDKVDIKYSIINPLNIDAHANGEFGKIDAKFNLSDFNLHLNLEPSGKMKKDFKSTLKLLKKSKTGVYSYDKTFKL